MRHFRFPHVRYLTYTAPNTKTRRQKHKAAKARSVAAKTAKELETKAGSETETTAQIFESVSDDGREGEPEIQADRQEGMEIRDELFGTHLIVSCTMPTHVL